MDSTKLLDASLINTLESTNPKFEVWINRILYQYRYIHALQAISKSLHGKWVGRCTCTYPENIDSIFQGELYMLRSSHLGSSEHTSLFLYLLHPR